MATTKAIGFVAHENVRKSSNSTNVNSSKSKKRGADYDKQKFPRNKCKQLGFWAAECPYKHQHAGDRFGKSAASKKADAFPVHVMGASRANSVEADSWYVRTVRHGTLRRRNMILSYTKFDSSETIVLSNKSVLIQAYGQGIINVVTCHCGAWHDAKLK
jgi:hypothetical protein